MSRKFYVLELSRKDSLVGFGSEEPFYFESETDALNGLKKVIKKLKLKGTYYGTKSETIAFKLNEKSIPDSIIFLEGENIRGMLIDRSWSFRFNPDDERLDELVKDWKIK